MARAKKVKTEKVTKAEYARRIGVKPPQISRLIRQGKLPVEPDGKIDVVKADVAIKAHRDPARAHLRKSKLPSVTLDAKQAEAYQDARTAREEWNAKLAELEYQKSAGELVDRQKVGASLFMIGRSTRDSLLRIPARISEQLARERDPRRCRALLTEELHKALLHLADEELTRAVST